MQIQVEWTVSGISYVDISEEEYEQVENAGVDPDDAGAVIRFLNTEFDGDVLHDAVSDFDTRNAPTLVSAVWEDE